MKRAALLVALLCVSTWACAQAPGMWRLESIAKSEAPAVRLYKGKDRTQVGVVSTARARMIMDVKAKLEKEAGVTAQMVLADGARPNAFATPASKDGPIIGINLGMMQLLGDDRDAYAAVLGHEYAHLTLKHREARMDRESLRMAGTVLLTILLATQGVNYGAADLANLTTQAVSMTFSRDEERDADSTGLKFAAAAGFDPHGAVRVWERMAAQGGANLPFLSSHPASAERVENMKELAKSLSSATALVEAEYLDGGVRIHRVFFAEADAKVVVRDMPESTRTTLKVGDRLLGCDGATPAALTLRDLASCRSSSGAYAFLVEREEEHATAVLLKPRPD